MKTNFKRLVSSLFLLSILAISAYAQEESSGKRTVWAINEVSGSKHKIGKVYKGPFNDLETAIANWYYYQLEPKKKYGITKNSNFVTDNPIAIYRNIWDTVEHDFSFDRESAIKKYRITVDSKIEKKYEKELKSGKANIANSGVQKETRTVNAKKSKEVNEIIYDENDNSIKVSEEPIVSVVQVEEPVVEESQPVIEAEREPETEIESEPEPEETPEPETEIQPEPEPEPVQEEIPEPVIQIEEPVFVPEIDLKSLMEELAKTPVQRYSKEYLQDYITVDEIPEPQDAPAVKELIKNPDEADNFGTTALMKAAKAGNDWQIKALLESGANVNLQDKDGWTALMYAVRYQEGITTVQLLLNANADVKIKNNYNTSAIILCACYNNNPEVLKSLLNYYSISDKEVLKSFILLLSTKQSSEYIQTAKLHVYLDKAIPLNNFYEGKTPLMYAAYSGNSTEVIKLLMEHGATTTLRSTEGKSAFDYAVENPNLKHDEIYWSLNRK